MVWLRIFHPCSRNSNVTLFVINRHTRILPSLGALNNTPFTAFAPTDDTFLFTLTTLNIPPEKLTAPEFLPVLTTVLTYHVSLDKYSPAVCVYVGGCVGGDHGKHPYISPPPFAQNLTSKPTTEVTTIAGLPLTLNYTTGTYAEGASSPLTIGAVESSASVDLKNAISIPECGVYVYPINSVMLPRGGAAALAALGSGPLAPAAAPAAAAISG